MSTKTAREFVEHYKKSDQLKTDLDFLKLDDNDRNAHLLEIVIWSMTNHVVSELLGSRAAEA